jgi:hypothetical protein
VSRRAPPAAWLRPRLCGNLDAAQLQTTGGQPELIGTVNGTAGSFNGACAYHASASTSGVLYSELTASATDKFRMYKSHKTF